MPITERDDLTIEERIERIADHFDGVDVEVITMLISELRDTDPEKIVPVLDTARNESFPMPVGVMLKIASSEILARSMAIVVLTEDDMKDEMITTAPDALLRIVTEALRDFIVKVEANGEIDDDLLKITKERTIFAEAELMRRDAQQQMNA